MTEDKLNELKTLSYKISKDIIDTGFGAGQNGVHFGSCLSLADILSALYSGIVNFDVNDIEHRDRMVLSKGHGAMALYCALYERGHINKDELSSFEHNGTQFCAHSKRNLQKGLEFAGGSLSLGISHAVGVARACMLKKLSNRVFVIVGDGELNEGLCWESLMFASQYKLKNLTVIVDYNNMQAYGKVEDIMNVAPLEDKFKAFGFKTKVVDGHDIGELYEALLEHNENTPNVVIAKTIKGKGVSFMENKAKWHYTSINESRYQKAVKELTAKAE